MLKKLYFIGGALLLLLLGSTMMDTVLRGAFSMSFIMNDIINWRAANNFEAIQPTLFVLISKGKLDQSEVCCGMI